MSHWTYVRGMITVAPMGRSVPEREYVLKAVLEHLPKVKGSEGDMEILLTQPKDHDLYTSHDEFFEVIPRHDGRAHQQTKYTHHAAPLLPAHAPYLLMLPGLSL